MEGREGGSCASSRRMVEVAAFVRSPPAYFFYGTFAGADVNKQDVHLQTALSICVKRLNKCVATPGKWIGWQNGISLALCYLSL